MISSVHQSMWGQHDSMAQLQTLRPIQERPERLSDWSMRQAQWYDYGFRAIPLSERYADFCRRLENVKQYRESLK